MMNKFFFITTYDDISGKILASILNIHPDIKCHTANVDVLLPPVFILTADKNQTLSQPYINPNDKVSVDKFIQLYTDPTKKFTGHTQSFTALELQYKTISEKTKTPYSKANIIVPPMLRINFLLHTWKRCGLTLEKLVCYIEKRLYELENNKHRAFELYDYSYYYKHILNTVKHTPITEASKIFVIALAKVIAFDSADIPTPGKNFNFETLLSDEQLFIDFIKHLTNDSIKITPSFKQQLILELQDARTSIKNMPFSEWESWQTNLLDNYVKTQLQTIYYPHIDKPLSYYYSKFNAYTPLKDSVDTTKVSYSKLVSIQLNSNRPAQLSAYFDNIEETAENLKDIEVLVNIDEGDLAMKSLLDSNIPIRKFTLKYIETPKQKSFCDLWKPINNLLEIADPDAYFLLNISDEMFFITPGWDTILKKYVGFFPDHFFRLRASRNKFRNYFDRWECSFTQDGIPITTKKWVDIGGNWNPCFGPDSFQQLVSFYLTKEGIFSNIHFQRDVPFTEIQFAGDVPAIGISEDKRWKHISDHIKAMEICQSYKMQLEARRRAVLIKANILAMKNKYENYTVKTIPSKKEIHVTNKDNHIIIAKYSYKVSRIAIRLTNYWRRLYFNKYFGDGIEKRGLFFKSFLHYLSSKYKFFYFLKKKIRYAKYKHTFSQLSTLQDENKRLIELCYLLSIENNMLEGKLQVPTMNNER